MQACMQDHLPFCLPRLPHFGMRHTAISAYNVDRRAPAPSPLPAPTGPAAPSPLPAMAAAPPADAAAAPAAAVGADLVWDDEGTWLNQPDMASQDGCLAARS